MNDQCCETCWHYQIMYCECTCDDQRQGDKYKNPDDGTDCDFYESINE